MSSRRILVVEDEAPIRDMLCFVLEQNGYQAATAADYNSALNMLAEPYPDLVLLDWMLPGGSGIQIAKKMKQHEITRNIPIIMITARGEEEDKVRGLEVGADDYVTKPFSVEELLARVRAQLRDRLPDKTPAVLDDGYLHIDLARRLVTCKTQEVELTPKEYAVLATLAQHRQCVITQKQLLEQIWGPTHGQDTHYLRIVISHLRQKIGDDPTEPKYLKTEAGVGYRLML